MLGAADGYRLYRGSFGAASRDFAGKRGHLDNNSGTIEASNATTVGSRAQHRLKYASEQTGAMMTNPDFMEQPMRFEERQKTNEHLWAKLEKPDSADPHLLGQMRLVQSQADVIKSETPSLVEVNQSSAQKRGVNPWKALSSLLLMRSPSRAFWPFNSSEHQKKTISDVGSAPRELRGLWFDKAERSESPSQEFGEGDPSNDTPKDEEHSDRVLEQIQGSMSDEDVKSSGGGSLFPSFLLPPQPRLPSVFKTRGNVVGSAPRGLRGVWFDKAERSESPSQEFGDGDPSNDTPKDEEYLDRVPEQTQESMSDEDVKSSGGGSLFPSFVLPPQPRLPDFRQELLRLKNIFMGIPARVPWPSNTSERQKKRIGDVVGSALNGLRGVWSDNDKAERSESPLKRFGNGDLGNDAPEDEDHSDRVHEQTQELMSDEAVKSLQDVLDFRQELMRLKSNDPEMQDITLWLLKHIDSYLLNTGDEEGMNRMILAIDQWQREFDALSSH